MPQKNIEVHAITNTTDGIASKILSSVEIKDVFTEKSIQTKGIWDTGATRSVITKSMAAALNLSSFGKRKVRGVHGIKEVNAYFVNITLDNKNIALNTRVTECDELSADNSVGMLIGMDIITKGDFTITNSKGKTKFTFQIPSIHDTDYVEENKKK